MASKASEAHALAPQLILVCISNTRDSSEFKHGVYGKRETAIAAFDFLFFSPILKSIQEKNGKKILTFTTQTNSARQRGKVQVMLFVVHAAVNIVRKLSNVSTLFQNTEKRVENMTHCRIFLIRFELVHALDYNSVWYLLS